jgi:hypothetical protein
VHEFECLITFHGGFLLPERAGRLMGSVGSAGLQAGKLSLFWARRRASEHRETMLRLDHVGQALIEGLHPDVLSGLDG